ncbi:MAG: glutathione S-transferase family protein [Pleurocapsa minor HA4230-MV1]|jgi:glutathione S-transferase|nr:glutathione S-transferase family protein [Pleurocapsa minor HA4230-MV1]
MTIKLYDFELSGNCYKVRLLMSLLGLEHELVPVNLPAGEHKSPKFLQLNPLGEVPVLTDGDLVLADSQAILVYLARKYGDQTWLPNDAESLSRIVRWLSIAAGEIRQGVATARLFYLFNSKGIDIEAVMEKSAIILQQLEQHLTDREWLELGHPTIADIAVFPYVALAADGKISLKPYPQILAWCDRLKQLPGFISMPGI